MQISAKAGSALGSKTDLLVLIVAKGDKIEFPKGFDSVGAACKRAGDLPSEFGKQSPVLYPDGRAAQKRVCVISAGEKPDAEKLRRCAALAEQVAEAQDCSDFVIALGAKATAEVDDERAGIAVGEGIELAAYEYVPPRKAKPKTKTTKRAAVMTLKGKASAKLTRGVKNGRLRAQAVCLARDLGNRGGNLLTPTKLAAEARKLAGGRIKYKALNEAQMQKLGMGSLLSVSRGSREQARLIILDYNPPGAKDTFCIVGKGLTFDAGGISIKPSAGMDEMRYDMCGGAAVLGLFEALKNGACKPKSRVVGLVPASENLPDGDANKPGDVVTAMNGLTIEVLNTDAEGRLILCDALSYAVKTYKPKAMIDLATLTGAVIIALGHEVSGMMGNDDKMQREVVRAGEAAGDRVWRLPLWDVHREQMKSKFADLRNINSRADGNGSTAGGAFLSYFVEDTPWVHLDIAGTAWNQKPKPYYRGGGSGSGVRVLIEWLSSR